MTAMPSPSLCLLGFLMIVFFPFFFLPSWFPHNRFLFFFNLGLQTRPLE